MDAVAVNITRQRGLALAKAKGARIREISPGKYLVPSASHAGSGYVVDIVSCTCTCIAFDDSPDECKHLWALRYHRHELEMPPDAAARVDTTRLTYSQNWPAYNRAQCAEKARVKVLLRGLCDGIVEPEHGRGRPRHRLGDLVYLAAMKVFGTMSGRRSTTDLDACQESGHVEKAIHYNSIFRLIERSDLTPLLQQLVEESARPLRPVERFFSPDGTGFSTTTYARWFD